MAEFTGITADKANEILGMSIVSGVVNAQGHLILTRQNGESIDAGNFTGIVADTLDSEVQQALDAALPNAVAGKVVDKGTLAGGALTLPEFNTANLPNAMVKVKLGGNVTFSSTALPSAPKANTQFVVRLEQDATGGRTFTTTGFKRSMGTLPISTTGGAIDLLVFLYDGSSWLAGLMGVDFK
jgi:hypothetical protein